MNFATLINIEDAIAGLINCDNMFTAYDVTKTLRHRGFHVRHREVRDAVRDYNFPVEYTEGVDSNIGAVVHYNMDDDVNDYDPNAVPEFVVNSGITGTASSATSYTIGTGPKTSSPVTSIVDKRSRFCVSASKLRDAGFVKGMHVKVLIDHDKIVIHDGTDGVKVTVDKSNNIRIAKGTLQNAFDVMPTTINIESTTGRVELSIDD
jgi:hypothetical protein